MALVNAEYVCLKQANFKYWLVKNPHTERVGCKWLGKYYESTVKKMREEEDFTRDHRKEFFKFANYGIK